MSVLNASVTDGKMNCLHTTLERERLYSGEAQLLHHMHPSGLCAARITPVRKQLARGIGVDRSLWTHHLAELVAATKGNSLLEQVSGRHLKIRRS